MIKLYLFLSLIGIELMIRRQGSHRQPIRIKEGLTS